MWKFYLLDSVEGDVLRHAVGVYNDGLRRILIADLTAAKYLQGVEVEAPPIFGCRLSLWGVALAAVGAAGLLVSGWEATAFSVLVTSLFYLLDRKVVGLKRVKFDARAPLQHIPTPYLALWTKVPKFMCHSAPGASLLRRRGKTPICPEASACRCYALSLFVEETTEELKPAKMPTLVSEEYIRLLLQ